MKVRRIEKEQRAIFYDGEYESYLNLLKFIREYDQAGAYTLSMWEREHPVYILHQGRHWVTVYIDDYVIETLKYEHTAAQYPDFNSVSKDIFEDNYKIVDDGTIQLPEGSA